MFKVAIEFLKGHDIHVSRYKVIVVGLLLFLTWQVVNHIPTQIEELKQDIKQVNIRLDDIYKLLLRDK